MAVTSSAGKASIARASAKVKAAKGAGVGTTSKYTGPVTVEPKLPKGQIGPGGAARGDDFAENINTASQSYGKTAEQAFKENGSTANVVTGYSPTVFSNANKIERVIPLLDSKANALNLSGTSNTTFNNTGDGGDSFGGDDTAESFDEILGLSTEKKKKKKGEMGETGEVLDPYTAQQMTLLQSMQKNADAQAKQALNSIQSKFAQRQQDQQRATESGLASIRQALNLGGSSRYAPISSQGIISAAEQAGIRALSDLDAQEQEAIGEIKSAQQANDFQLLEKKLNLLENVRSEKAKATSKLQEEVRLKEMESSRDNALAGLVQQGVTDPVEILNYLNFDDAGNQIGDFTIAEVTGALKNLNDITGSKGIGGTGFKLENKAIGQLLGTGFTAPDIKAIQADLNAGGSIDEVLEGVEDPDMQNALKEAFGLKSDTNTNVTPGVGAKTPVEEAIIRTRMFSRVAPMLNKGAISDSDADRINGFINEMRDANMSEQEIYDSLAGLPPEVNTPYNAGFRDIIVANSETMEKQTGNMGRLGQQLSSGNYQGAMNTAENLAMAEAQKLDPDGYMGTATAQNYLKKAKKLNELLVGAEDVIGPIEGTFDSIKGKLKNKSNKGSEIAAAITQLVAEMRHDLSGTAVTQSETAFLDPLIPSNSDTIPNFKIKLKSLDEGTLGKLNSTRSMVSLPTITTEQVIDPKKRLQVYSNDIYLPANGVLDL